MRKLIFLISIAVVAGWSPAAFSQADVQPEADRVLKAAHAYLSGLDSVAIKAVTSEETVYNDTHKLQFGGTLEMGIRRPSQLFAVVHEDYSNRRMYLNGGTFTVFDEDVNVYAQTPAPGPLNEVFARLYADHGIDSPGGELFSGQAYELLVEHATRIVYVGMGNVNGTNCHHVAGILPDMDWQLWIRAEGDPELCKYVVTDRDVPLAPQFSITFTEFEANAELSDSQFDFQPPVDAESIDFVK